MVRSPIAAAICVCVLAADSKEIPNPAGPGSSLPFLIAGANGAAYLSWVEPVAGSGHQFKYAIREGQGWRVPPVIAEGKRWFINWADYPTFLPLADGNFAAHWLEKFADSQYSYGLKLVQSRGAERRVTFAPKVAREQDYTGFVSLVALKERIGVAYLAPGARGGEEDKTLRFAALSREGVLESDELLDADVCTCCQTAAVFTDDGPVVAYRDHTAGEIRDISVVSYRNGKWTAPRAVHADGWKINACPVNGPAMAADRRRVALAWYTAANDKPRVRAVFSNDSGLSFGAPIQVDDGSPAGRAAVVLLADGTAAVAWIERLSATAAEIRVRRVSAEGARGASRTVSAVSPGRKTGFPKMIRFQGRLLVSWTDDRVRTAEVEIPGLL